MLLDVIQQVGKRGGEANVRARKWWSVRAFNVGQGAAFFLLATVDQARSVGMAALALRRDPVTRPSALS
jgi:hypothetical protein